MTTPLQCWSGGISTYSASQPTFEKAFIDEYNSSKIGLDDLKLMSIKELKDLLIEQIKVIDNRILLEALHRLLELEGLKNNVYMLSGAQRNANLV